MYHSIRNKRYIEITFDHTITNVSITLTPLFICDGKCIKCIDYLQCF